jgi:hypothetical protein
MKITAKSKKAFALLSALLLFIGITSAQMVSKAAAPVQLTVTNVKGKAGDTVIISISISSNSGLGAAELYIKYDSSKIEYKGNSAGSAANGGIPSVNPNFSTDGDYVTIKDSFIHTTGVMASGSLLDITFSIKSGWTGSTILELTAPEFKNPLNYQEIPHNIKNGTITIGTATTTTTTTNPTTTTTIAGVTTTSPAGETTAAVSITAPTTAPVTIPQDKVIEALGPDAEGWDRDYASLNKEQKEKIEDYFAEQGTSVIIQQDGVYVAPSDTSTAVSTTSNPNDDTTVGMKVLIPVAAVCVLLAAALGIVFIKRKKNRQN